MRTIAFLSIFIFSPVASFCQDDPPPPVVELGFGKPTNIPGTRLFISPPPGFSIASNFTGLQKGENAVIQVYDLVGGSFYTNGATFTKEAFEAKGITVKDYKDTAVSGFPAKLVYLEKKPDLGSYSMVFGDSTFSVMVMGAFPITDVATAYQVKRAMLSLSYNKKFVTDIWASAAFTLDDSKSKFKFSKAAANNFIYTIGGVKEVPDDGSLMIVGTLPLTEAMTPKSAAGTMLNALKQNGFTDVEIKQEKTFKVNGCDAYEAQIYAKLKGVSTMTYQLAVVKGDKAVVIQGLAKKDYESMLKEFKLLAKTIKMK